MKRSRLQHDGIPVEHTLLCEENFGSPLEYQQPRNGLITPPPDPNLRPSKIRRHGSKIMSVLRSLSNSASNTSRDETITPLSPSGGISKRVSFSFLRMPIQPTVVHRSQLRARPSLMSIDKGVSLVEVVPDVSLSTSAETSGNSGKSSVPENHNNSTGKTSQDSKFSQLAKVSAQSQHSPENNKTIVKQTVVESSLETPPKPIQEVEVAEVTPEPIPTVITVEKAAAAKIFFETHYNELLSKTVTPRSLRRRELEIALYEDMTSSSLEKEAQRQAWARRESDHLREIRRMKSRPRTPLCGDQMASMYEVVKVLGKGSFGVVRLVREKVTENNFTGKEKKPGDVYAMKVIRKSDMLRNSQEGHLRAERDFLVASEGSRWIVPLIASFQDASNLYLVMDYMPGGDFLGLLIRDNILSEAVTKWYIAEMILCIEEAHALRWIHRDVKPDNFLISASGHLKISDFGLAFDGHWSHDQSYYNNHRYSLLTKLGINVDGDSIDKKEGRSVAAAMKQAHNMMAGIERHEKKSSIDSHGEGILNWRNRVGNRSLARSIVGTSQYMAPEVVRGEFYDARCDWWSVAIILYECLYGHTPFLAEEGRAQTKMNIVNHKTTFSFPSKPAVSSRCQDLIRRMLQEKADRLCSKRYKTKDVASAQNRDHASHYVYPHDAEDIKANRWFRDIPWERLHLMTPPFVPVITGPDDTHYFDDEEPISDFSSSHDGGAAGNGGGAGAPPAATEEELDAALRGFNREIQILARGYVATTYDSARLRRIEREIDAFIMTDAQKEYLRAFVGAYGRRERKRPRDRLLRDRDVAPQVLEVRKRAAFLGYSYRRIRRRGSARRGGVGVGPGPGGGGGRGRGRGWGNGNGRGQAAGGGDGGGAGGIWHLGRVSIF